MKSPTNDVLLSSPTFGIAGRKQLAFIEQTEFHQVFSSIRTGGPLKPGFGLSGAVPHSLLRNGSASNIPTLNFAKNAKFRMGHPASANAHGLSARSPAPPDMSANPEAAPAVSWDWP